MIRSKAIKDFESKKENKRSKLYLWWIESDLSDYWKKFTWFFEGKYLRLKKLYEWHKNVFVHDYDFDAHGLYPIIEYKLKRIYPVLERGYAIQEDKDMKALRIAIKIAGRLREDNYDTIQINRHDKVWGKLKSRHDRVSSRDDAGKPLTYHYDLWREVAKTPKEKEQERKEYVECHERSDKQKLRDQQRLFAILTKYIAVWWD